MGNTTEKEAAILSDAEKGVFVVAEIGKNFIQTQEERGLEEYIESAKQLIRAAKEAGADAVKFQTHNLEDEQADIRVVAPHFSGSDRYNWVKRNDRITPMEFWQELKGYCQGLGIIFFSTPMSRGAAQKLEEVGVPFWKVGSGDILDFVMLDFLAATKKPVMLSSGMSTVEELDAAITFLQRRGSSVILLHCVSKYPCPPEDLRLETIDFLKQRYGIPVGFSDHSIGYESALAAAGLGTRVIEKHFSSSRDLWGSDHKVSLTPPEFQEMVQKIRKGEHTRIAHYGKGVKVLQEDEAVFRPIFRKSLVAGQNIQKGTVLGKEMIYAMRPQAYLAGLPSEKYEQVLGKRLVRDVRRYDPIRETDYE